ncbi:DUF4097 family beta strand repeat protein [bacterium]|nr:DUF4097 family beta strand repeat protein [bacterium]
MRSVLVMTLVVLSSAFALENFETEIPAEGVNDLRIDWANGDVELIADSSASVRITAVGSRGGTTLKTSDWLEYADFSLTGTEAVLVFETRGRATNIAVDLTVRFPQGLRVSVDCGNGGVTVSGGSSLEVDAGNGNLDVSGVTGETDLDAGNGNVELALPAGFAAEAAVDSGNGNVELTIGGGFSGEVEVNAGNGDVTATFADVPDGLRIDAQTGMGSVKCTIPGAEVTEGFMGGAVTLDGRGPELDISAGMGDIGIFVE